MKQFSTNGVQRMPRPTAPSSAKLFVKEAARAMARTRDGVRLDRDGRLVAAYQQSAKRRAAW